MIPDEEAHEAPDAALEHPAAAAAPSGSPTKAAVSPVRSTSSTKMESPTKGKGKSKGRLWDSLWQFDISLESGKKK